MQPTKGRSNKQDNWARLSLVIAWSRLTINSFAKSIGIQRAENIYNIKRGHYGKSSDLADRIVAKYPEIDRTWLLSGMGTMIRDENIEGAPLLFYNQDAESVIEHIESITPSGSINVPYMNNCDFVIRSFSRSMNDPQCAAADLFLKRVYPEDIVQGNEFILTLDDNTTIWRKIRSTSDDNGWRLVSRNRDEYPDIVIDKSRVVNAWRVMARLAVMSN